MYDIIIFAVPNLMSHCRQRLAEQEIGSWFIDGVQGALCLEWATNFAGANGKGIDMKWL